MQANSGNEQPNNADKKQNNQTRSLVTIVLLVVFLTLLVGGGCFYGGYRFGKVMGTKDAVTSVTDLLNPIKAVSNNAAFPYTAIGKVDGVSKDKLTVKLADGTTKSMVINDKTAVTKSSKVVSVSEIQKNNDVTVFTTGSGKDLVAVRVIIR